ncbi:enhanced serine sensitivity protein SseB [Streptomyces sp. NPDC000941]
MNIPEQHGPAPAHGGFSDGVSSGIPASPAFAAFPGNELEEVLVAAVDIPGAGARIVETLARSRIWVPLPNGGGPDSNGLDLPTMEIEGGAYVPVFSSEQQFLQIVGAHMAFTVAPAVEFARGLPPQLGIAVNPGGPVGVPLPPLAVAELCRAGRSELDGPATGGRVRLFEPDWQDEPVDFLAAAGLEFGKVAGLRTARRALASVEGEPPALFVGVELDVPGPEGQATAVEALGRALGAVPLPWTVQLVLLDIAQDPVTDWIRERVRPFYDRDR